MPDSSDMYMKIWDVWWLENLFTTGQSFYYSEELFYPLGLDISYNPTSWTTTAVIWLLAQLIGAFSSYKILILTAVFTSAYTAYILIQWLTKHQVASWFGGVVYSFAPYHFADLRGHPDLAQIAPIPIAVLFFVQGLTTGSVKKLIGAGLMVGIVAWTGLYLFGFTMITLGLLAIYIAFTNYRWQQRRFWYLVAIFSLSSLILVIPRLYPLFRNTSTLSFVISEKYSDSKFQADVLAYIIPPIANPILEPLAGDLSTRFAKSENKYPSPYLGIVASAAALSAFFWCKKRNEIWIWSALAALFIMMSIGPFLRFGGETYTNIRLPASVLLNFDPLRAIRPNLFHYGFLLPFAVLVSYGMKRWFSRLESRRIVFSAVIAFLTIMIFSEYWIGQFRFRPLEVSPFYDQLVSDEQEYALIDLPMGYSESKRYLFLQSIHNRAIVEGMSSRMPPNAFDYIESNLLLERWQKFKKLDCSDFSDDSYIQAIEALMSDGFRYLILHREEENFEAYFEPVPVFYKDSKLTVYSLSDMAKKLPCDFN